jgi:pyruvate dehydrogenase E1 component alpha subunit
MGTAVTDSSGQPELVKRAIGYGIKEGPRVDGMDMLKVYEATHEAVEYARKNGSVLMEALTYRYEGHGMSDKSFQNRVEELDYYHTLDPINKLRDHLCKIYPDAGPALEKLDQKAAAVVTEAEEFADKSPIPTYDDLVSNIYV